MQYYDMKETGKRILSLRQENGMTQTQFAKLFAVQRNQIGKIERGVGGMSIDLAVAIASEFQVSLDFLLMGKETKADLMKNQIYSLIEDLEEVAEML